MPDRTGNGYWLVTNHGRRLRLRRRRPSTADRRAQSVPVVDAVATPDGHGLLAALRQRRRGRLRRRRHHGRPLGYVNAFNPATAIFPTADGQGYWVAAARGDVFSYGDAPYMGSMAAAGLNGEIIAGFGF